MALRKLAMLCLTTRTWGVLLYWGYLYTTSLRSSPFKAKDVPSSRRWSSPLLNTQPGSDFYPVYIHMVAMAKTLWSSLLVSLNGEVLYFFTFLWIFIGFGKKTNPQSAWSLNYRYNIPDITRDKARVFYIRLDSSRHANEREWTAIQVTEAWTPACGSQTRADTRVTGLIVQVIQLVISALWILAWVFG